jgi:bifunctional N-acetylglucosamine-1-phosphate-uridyltransferase/glucosamine-1-phosphate-acetyltransferase GlmU-like protein
VSPPEINIADYVSTFFIELPFLDRTLPPWSVVSAMPALLAQLGNVVDRGVYRESDGCLVHESARIEAGAILKAPLLVSAGCFVAAGAYLRDGVFLGRDVTIGPGCELKAAIVMAETTLAHFNFVGDTIVGCGVNVEAGAVVANQFNERDAQEITVRVNGRAIATGVTKFGALIGDGCRLGANAVLSPSWRRVRSWVACASSTNCGERRDAMASRGGIV